MGACICFNICNPMSETGNMCIIHFLKKEHHVPENQNKNAEKKKKTFLIQRQIFLVAEEFCTMSAFWHKTCCISKHSREYSIIY